MSEGLRGRALAEAAWGWACQHDRSREGLDIGSFAAGVEHSGIRIAGDKPIESLRSAVNRAHDRFERVDARWVWKDATTDAQVAGALSGHALAEVAHAVWLARWSPERLAHYQDLTTAIVRAGHPIAGVDKAATLRSAIGHDPRFLNAARGYWRLRG